MGAIMLLPFFLYFIVFHYVPLLGNVIAFTRYIPARGISASPWAGLTFFREFFSSTYFYRVLRTTVIISPASLIVGLPAPIVLALMLNEVWSSAYKRTIQSVTYLPHFVSLVAVAGLIVQLSSMQGLFSDIIVALGGRRVPLLQQAWLFVPIALYPFYSMVTASFGDGNSLTAPQGLLLRPLDLTFIAYERVASNPKIARGFPNSIYLVVTGAGLNMAVTSLSAYALSRRHLVGRSFLPKFAVFTMIFDRGLIPLVRGLGMYGSPWSVIMRLPRIRTIS